MMQERGRWHTTEYSLADAAVRTVFFVIVTLFCLYSAVWMARDIFPEWELSKTAWMWTIGLAVWTIALYELGIRALPHFQIFPGLLVPAVYGAISYAYAKPHQIDLEDGACAMVTQFLVKFNAHLGTSYYIWTGKTELMGLAFAFWTLVILLGLLILSLLLGKRVFLLLLPAAVFAAELMIGFVPQWKGLALFFAALLFMQADGGGGFRMLSDVQADGRERRHMVLRVRADRRRTESWYIRWLPLGCLAGAAVLILLLGSVLSDATVEGLMKKSPDVLAFQRKTEQNVSDMMNTLIVRKQENVSNQAPRYTGKEVLKVTVSHMPEDDILLKGFYGTDYRNGNWVCDTAKFKDACARAGYSEKEAEEELMQVQYNLVTAYTSFFYSRGFYDYQTNIQEENVYTVEYTGTGSRYAYLPYVIDYVKGQGKERLNGDVTVQRAWNQKVFSFSGWSNPIGLAVITNMTGAENGNIFEWYDGFAQSAYLDTSDRVPSFQEYLQTISEDDFKYWYEYLLAVEESQMDALQRNQYRMELALFIRAYLQYYQSYSLNLEPLPQGEDPVRFFLMKSRSGYCVHFASAAVMMLRQLGVPARYVSGYVARRNDFIKKGDAYVASLKDRDAHAWAEIYLENLGWVPVDVTPGTAAWADGQNGNDTSNAGENADAGSQETQTDTDETQTDADETQTDTDETQTDADDNEDEKEHRKDTGSLKLGSWKYAFVTVAAVFLLLACWFFCCIIRLYHTAAFRDIKAGKYSRAVRRMNSSIFWKLYLGRKIRQKDLPDAQYEKILKTVCQNVSADDWTRFMHAARFAAFAKNELAKEEAEFCWQIYSTLYPKVTAHKRFTT